jgi:hypothetical protein
VALSSALLPIFGGCLSVEVGRNAYLGCGLDNESTRFYVILNEVKDQSQAMNVSSKVYRSEVIFHSVQYLANEVMTAELLPPAKPTMACHS